MANKKGARTERELLSLLWSFGFPCIRVAGSGLSSYPNPDLLAGKDGRVLAIECKSLKKGVLYLTEADIEQLTEFSSKFGAEPWIAVRFNNLGWYFINPKILKKKNKNFNISKNFAQHKGLTLKQLLRGKKC